VTQLDRRELSPQLITMQSRHCPAIGFVRAGQVRCWLVLAGEGMGGEGKYLKKKEVAKENRSFLVNAPSPPAL